MSKDHPAMDEEKAIRAFRTLAYEIEQHQTELDALATKIRGMEELVEDMRIMFLNQFKVRMN